MAQIDNSPNRDEDRQLLARMLAYETYKQALSPEARTLYSVIENTTAYDSKTHTSTYTIPAQADPKALKEALKLLDLAGDPASRIILQQEMPRDTTLVGRMDPRIAGDLVRQMGIGDAPVVRDILDSLAPLPKENADFVWEGMQNAAYTRTTRSMVVDDFNAAVKLGADNLALYFTLSPAENAGRHFTNVAEIKDTSALIDYLEDVRRNLPLDRPALRRMFSRVAANPAEQAKFSAVDTVAAAIEVLKKEPAGSYFLTPSNGGFIKLEADDRAYNRKGEQVWPPKTPPAKGFRLSTGL